MSRDPTAIPVDHASAKGAAEPVLDLPGADEVEVVVMGSRTGLTRFALSEIIQNTVRSEVRAYVRVAVGRRVATTVTTQLDAEHLMRAATSALEATRASRPDEDWRGLPPPERVGRAEGCWRYDDATACTTPEERARRVTGLLAAAEVDNVAGIFETSAHSFSVFSSVGMDCADAYTRCVTTCLVDTGEATGWGDWSSHREDQVDGQAAARRALDKARRGSGATEAPPGRYQVVLEPAAVATMLEYLSYCGMGARQYIDGESFLVGAVGGRIAAPSVTLADDVWHPASVGPGFDFEGVPKRRVAVIDDGIATGPVTDWRTAPKVNAEPTGHYSGSTEFGPYASHLVLQPGTASPEDLIGEVDAGFLVTRFHYVNVLDRPATLLTGMTRDGTFRIHNGEVGGPVHNFRFAHSVLDALRSTTGVGHEVAAFAPDYGSFGCTVAPALRVEDFNFASTTSH
ncbi:MAG: TldD/PmbA family protein [Actinomycetota bacterium]